jgi:hypothetical protein
MGPCAHKVDFTRTTSQGRLGESPYQRRGTNARCMFEQMLMVSVRVQLRPYLSVCFTVPGRPAAGCP